MLPTIIRGMSDDSTLPPIKIPYESLKGRPETLWPLVELQLGTSETLLSQSIPALVDSGANTSLLNPEFIPLLGFTEKDLQFIPGGISASGTYRFAILPHETLVNIYGYTFIIRFTVIENRDLVFPCILGQDSIFQWARLDFQRFKGFFEIKFRKNIN